MKSISAGKTLSSYAFVCLIVTLNPFFVVGAEKDYVERSSERVRVKVTGVASSAHNCPAILGIADEIIRESPGRPLYIVRTSDRNSGCADGVLVDHTTYDGVLFTRSESERRTGSCGEAVVTPRGEVVRIRSDANEITQCTKGINPLEITVGAKRVELNWLFYWQPPETLLQALKIFGTFEQELSAAEATEVFREALGRFPAAYVELDLGNIPWFPYDMRFPPFYVFGGAFEPPRDEREDLPPMISCSGTAFSPKCEIHRWKQ